MAAAGTRDTVPVMQKITKCMMIGEWILGNLGAEHGDMVDRKERI